MDIKKRQVTRGKPSLAELIPPGVDALLSTRQVCAALSIGPTKFRQLCRNEQFPPPDLRMGQDPRWRSSTFNKWLGDQTKNACPGALQDTNHESRT